MLRQLYAPLDDLYQQYHATMAEIRKSHDRYAGDLAKFRPSVTQNQAAPAAAATESRPAETSGGSALLRIARRKER
jgi:hypothetical protein